VKDVNGILFVTYAKQDAARHDDVAGPGNGFIDEFDTSGHFLRRFASGTGVGGNLTALNSPIGMTVAPDGFGRFGGDLLVGNFGDSHVSAFDLRTGRFRGQLEGTDGQPLVLNGGVNSPPHDTKGLWGIAFGNGHGAPASTPSSSPPAPTMRPTACSAWSTWPGKGTTRRASTSLPARLSTIRPSTRPRRSRTTTSGRSATS
jgi:uncharacterized protein (TIGR03118 family)